MNALMGRIVRRLRDRSLSPYRRRVPDIPEVREVRPDEYEIAGEVTALAYVEFAESASPEWAEYLKRIADIAGRATRTTVLVAVAGDRILGSATLELTDHIESTWTNPVAPDEAHLRMLGVHPNQRRKGIGRLLVNACIDVARAHGRHRLTLETTDRMRAAQALYRSMGFRWLRAREVAPGLSFQDYELRLDAAAGAPVATAH
jgi:ribosomal protein S18 acetylase RimI-like enzyme